MRREPSFVRSTTRQVPFGDAVVVVRPHQGTEAGVGTAHRHDGTPTAPVDADLVSGARALRRASLAQRVGSPQHADGVDHVGDEPSGGGTLVHHPCERLRADVAVARGGRDR